MACSPTSKRPSSSASPSPAKLPTVLAVDYPHGPCAFNGRLPADAAGAAPLSRDQITLGTQLARQDRLLIARDAAPLRTGSVRLLEMSVFGYRIGFTGDADISGRFGELARQASSSAAGTSACPRGSTVRHGYARRYINAYVPVFDAAGDHGRYAGTPAAEDDSPHPGQGKTSTTSPAPIAARAPTAPAGRARSR